LKVNLIIVNYKYFLLSKKHVRYFVKVIVSAFIISIGNSYYGTFLLL